MITDPPGSIEPVDIYEDAIVGILPALCGGRDPFTFNQPQIIRNIRGIRF